ncbi:tyrosine protein phosphatase non-receptor type 61F, putative [Entamoeba invadens IP1]|uniref:tyrosine protein phosphatase non-receptor type 61F, putative n=1 Tax=Entamoeba invadens IP1 TaxID=370355 RepID=UPI0002C3D4B1|nr:tyrosine protein phosphatase non-receptor type 61F, putative [Entamoeba invadens IP1]ELP90411.1 tyrosine protein phosphatase non-receptor type 61F, putative [Entamoeba invadens IP1]|eukprot:XP_004257182.1 tyrosine protein phosphatase non-receptor type 61F, putative [Entamoeba invadens IP1]
MGESSSKPNNTTHKNKDDTKTQSANPSDTHQETSIQKEVEVKKEEVTGTTTSVVTNTTEAKSDSYDSSEGSGERAEEGTFDWVQENTSNIPSSEFQTASDPQYVDRNRYANVLANESTRVILSERNYINANYIFGKKYISCQAPLENTLNDFYTMLFEQNVSVVVMLTKFKEGGKAKSTAYFPMDDEEDTMTITYRIHFLDVLYSEEDEKKTQTQVRLFQVTNTKTNETKKVVHIHYIGWPDFGTPEDKTSFCDLACLALICREGTAKGRDGPIVIHCSAGLGRSGTFIGVLRVVEEHVEKLLGKKTRAFEKTTDTMETFEKKVEELNKDINTANFAAEMVVAMRSERKGIVQTKEQFKFLVDSLDYLLADIYGKQTKKTGSAKDILEELMSDTLKLNLDDFYAKLN